MREELIQALVDEILPRVKQSGDAEEEILKYANEKNLSPALVETMGQLYNISKSLSFMEKSANRGGDFEILNVDRLMSRFIDAPSRSKLAVKEASFKTPSEPRTDLHRYFMDRTYTKPEEPDPAVKVSSHRKQAYLDRSLNRVCLEFCKQASFEFLEDQRRVLQEINDTLRRRPSLKFADVEQDVLDYFGHENRSWTEKIASLLEKDYNLSVSRAPNEQGPKRPIRTDDDLFSKVATIIDLGAKVRRAKAFEKLYAPEESVKESSESNESGGIKDIPLKMSTTTTKNRPFFSVDDITGLFGRRERPQPSPSSPTAPESTQSPGVLDRANKQMSGILQGIGNRGKSIYRTLAQEGANQDQPEIDRDYQNAEQIATLQQLMVSDDQIAEHDPDRVVEIFNTVREAAPSLARDPNSMRVILRHALQYEGIDTFTIKNFLETELARQKKDEGERSVYRDRYPETKPQQRPSPDRQPETRQAR